MPLAVHGSTDIDMNMEACVCIMQCNADEHGDEVENS